MPEIIKEDKQVQALNEINVMLAKVTDINAMLASTNLFGVIDAKSGKKGGIRIVVSEDKDIQKVTQLLDGMRNKLKKDIIGKAEKYRISLDDADLKTLDFDMLNSKTESSEEKN